MIEQFFTTWDGVRLFYRAWIPAEAATSPPARALVLFHRGHEHSGRLADLVARLDLPGFAVFAWDARGHGQSPGERGWADSFACLVRDADCFVKHIVAEHGIAVQNIAVVAHSVGAVIAAAWVHDYAPPIRAMVLASPAFRVKLYVPFAVPFLRVQRKLRKRAYVTSYVRPSMLTHDPAEAAGYARDPLISRAVSVNLLLDMNDTAARIVEDAEAIRTPTLVISSGKDYVVRVEEQRAFFGRLGSPMKEMQEYPGFYHDLWHERDWERPVGDAREFLLRAFDRPVEDDLPPTNQANYKALLRRPGALSPDGLLWGAQRLFLKTEGQLSRGIRLGWSRGFDSGDSLDYVYRNRPEGVSPLGKLIDGIYLSSPGWRGIRQRKANLEELLSYAIGRVRSSGKPVRIFDPAAGLGRYLTEAVSRLQDNSISLTMRDWDPENVVQAARVARESGLGNVETGQGDAFDRSSLASLRPRPSIAIVSGLYELFADNRKIRQSLLGLADALDDDGFLIYTNQPWHPQLEMIARVLDNREGQPWVMRCRSQAEMDALVEHAGFEKLETRMDEDGIFTVSLARRRATSPQLVAGVSQERGEGL